MQTELVCRLCAVPKEPDEIHCSIDDVIQSIERKLIDCCDWNSHRSHADLPKSVCYSCYLLLEQSWYFRRTVSRAQDKLNARMVSGGTNAPLLAGSLAEVKIECDSFIDTADDMGEHSNINTSAGLRAKNTESDGSDSDVNEAENVWCDDNSYEDDYDDDAADQVASQDFNDYNQAEYKEEPYFNEGKESAHSVAVSSKAPSIKVTKHPNLQHFSFPGNQPNPADISKMVKCADLNEDGSIIGNKVVELNLATWDTIKTKCSLCDNFAGDHVKLQNHYKDVHPNTRLELTCPFCDKTERFLTGQLYRHHIVKEHFPHLALSCYHCHALFTNVHQLNRHLRLHPKDPTRNVCPHCRKYFAHSWTLFAHMATHMPENERPVFECYLCKDKFIWRGSLHNHMKRHLGVKKTSICHQCGKVYRTPSDLKKHMNSHSTHRRFICNLCPKSFKLNRSLSHHHRVVHDRGQYKCDECGYRAFHKEYLHSHMLRLHHDSRKFPCNNCDKRFLTIRALKSHQKSHWKDSMT